MSAGNEKEGDNMIHFSMDFRIILPAIDNQIKALSLYEAYKETILL